MRIQFSGKDLDIGESLQTHVNGELGETLAKYAGRPTDATVTFLRDGHLFGCEFFVHLSTGLVVQANGRRATSMPASRPRARRWPSSSAATSAV